MSKQVRVKITSSDKVKVMNEDVAQRFAKADPKEYVILDNPTIEVVRLAPVQKKSVEVVEGKPFSIGQNVPSNETVAPQVTTTQTTQDAIKPKMGRPPKQPA